MLLSIINTTFFSNNDQHRVVPKGKRRFALTCRNIVLETIEDDDARAEAAHNSILPEVSELWDYPKDEDVESHNENAGASKRAADEPQSTTGRTAKRHKTEA